MVQVKKDGPNKGRYFYACASQRDQQCKFFQWADEKQNKPGNVSTSKMCLADSQSITTYLKGQRIAFYCECILVRKVPDSYKNSGRSIPLWVKKRMGIDVDNTKKKLYIRLPRKESSTSYSKDDLWIVSQHLEFESGTTFLAKSAFYGPVGNEVEIEPINGYYPSNWPGEVVCHAIHADNAGTELSCILNISEHINPISLPILPHILHSRGRNTNCDGNFSAPKMYMKQLFVLPWDVVEEMVYEYESKFHLNEDQSTALRSIAGMFNSEANETPISLIHGVFGAGKSYLLAVVVMFLVELFEKNEPYRTGEQEPLKLLISSMTNVAVDRILMGLQALGFEEFIRVGSVKKIAKPVLPYSVHAAGTDSQELRDLQEMLKSDLTPSEKINVRKSIEQHRKGVNKKKLTEVRVVGVTCAACAFSCLDNFKFPVVLLDECSQMTEPVSMLPVAKFECQRLVLVGDPKQLDPTIQGSEAAHSEGLEQTLFDRMSKMGHPPTMLRTQYRCHPTISAIANSLFYDQKLLDGITGEGRPPLVSSCPPLCFLDVPNGQEKFGVGGSFFNDCEAQIVADLIEILIGNGLEASQIGVITLYKAQMYKVLQLIQAPGEARGVQVSTVDAFQGGERDVIILSCVRSHHVGFIDSDKRMNVALTRAMNHLFIVGNKRNLNGNRLWSQVIRHCSAVKNGVQNAEVFIKENKPSQDEVNNSGSSATRKTKKRKRENVSRSRSRTPLSVLNDNSSSPAMDLEDSSQDTTSSVDTHFQDHRFVYIPENVATNTSGGSDFMCGLDDSSQSSAGSGVVRSKRRRPRLIIRDNTPQGLTGEPSDKFDVDSDSELPDI